VLCAEGGQDIYRLLGRDPEEEPLSALEFAVFIEAVLEIARARVPRF